MTLNHDMEYVQCQHSDSLPAFGLQRRATDVICSKFSICELVLQFPIRARQRQSKQPRHCCPLQGRPGALNVEAAPSIVRVSPSEPSEQTQLLKGWKVQYQVQTSLTTSLDQPRAFTIKPGNGDSCRWRSLPRDSYACGCRLVMERCRWRRSTALSKSLLPGAPGMQKCLRSQVLAP